MLDQEAIDKGADILGSAIAALFEEGVELAALSFDDVDVMIARLDEIRRLADDAMILVAALAVLMRRSWRRARYNLAGRPMKGPNSATQSSPAASRKHHAAGRGPGAGQRRRARPSNAGQTAQANRTNLPDHLPQVHETNSGIVADVDD